MRSKDTMKRLTLALVVLLIPVSALGGTLFPGYIELGGYGHATGTITQLGNGEAGFFLGGGGGLILNRTFLVGADLGVLMNDIEYRTIDGEDRFIEYTLANLNLSYLFWPDALVHPALSMRGGIGWLRLRNPDKAVDERDPDADTTFQFQPAAHVILNLTRTTRLMVSGGYRWVAGINTEDFVDQDAEGAFGSVAFLFGAF
jgi:hypothetical protein